MTASILHGSTTTHGNNDENERVRGQVTSGGSESILLAVLAAREFSFRAGRCVRFGDEGRRPEIVLAASAHAAFFKAAHYFGMRVKVVKPSSSSSSNSSTAVAPRLTAGDVRRHLTRNTALVVASAPSFPHGVVDDVEGIARETSRRGVPLHVDCCLGGFVLAFAKEAAEQAEAEAEAKKKKEDENNDDADDDKTSPSSSTSAIINNRRRKSLRFDFAVPGVTSISIDVHKFGLSHKGTSVLLFKGSDRIDGATLRRSAFVATSDWPGGLYVSPGVAGSRSGALLAAAWASMVSVGRVRKEEGEREKGEREKTKKGTRKLENSKKKTFKKFQKSQKLQEGYVSAARSIFSQVDEFISGIEAGAENPADPLSELEVIRGDAVIGDGDDDGDDEGGGAAATGFPLGPVVAFRSKPSSSLNIFVLNDLLSSQSGWHLNALQRPAALHCCFTAQHARGGARRLLRDLRSAVVALRERERAREKEEESESEGDGDGDGDGGSLKKVAKKKKGVVEEEGMAPVYGMASASPDRGLVGEFLLTFQDVLLTG